MNKDFHKESTPSHVRPKGFRRGRFLLTALIISSIMGLTSSVQYTIADECSIPFPVFSGISPPVSGSSGTLLLNEDFVDERVFHWISSDTILGDIDTVVTDITRWLFLGANPTRLVFVGSSDGATFYGNVLFDPYNRAVVDVTKGSTRVRYLLTGVNNVQVDFTVPFVIRVGKSKSATATVQPPGIVVEFEANNFNVTVEPSSGSGVVDLTLTGESTSSSVNDTFIRAKLSSENCGSSDPFTIYDVSFSGSITTSGTDNLVPELDVLPVPSEEEVIAPLITAMGQIAAASIFFQNLINSQIEFLENGGDPNEAANNISNAEDEVLAFFDESELEVVLPTPSLTQTRSASPATFFGTAGFILVPSDLSGSATFGFESAAFQDASVNEPPPWTVPAGSSQDSGTGTLNPSP